MLRHSTDSFATLNDKIIHCERCPRLRTWCELVGSEKRKSFSADEYWKKPVPNFGDPNATCLIVGLAPAVHGGNRTGRMFTGDRSGDWLFRALHKAGVANQAESHSKEDGLSLTGVLITACVHCAPPDNKPAQEEILQCRNFLLETLELRQWKSILCLGGIAWDQTFKAVRLISTGSITKPKFAHLQTTRLDCGTKIVGSYHPSQQNTFTGRLTEPMFDAAIREFLSQKATD